MLLHVPPGFDSIMSDRVGLVQFVRLYLVIRVIRREAVETISFLSLFSSLSVCLPVCLSVCLSPLASKPLSVAGPRRCSNDVWKKEREYKKHDVNNVYQFAFTDECVELEFPLSVS